MNTTAFAISLTCLLAIIALDFTSATLAMRIVSNRARRIAEELSLAFEPSPFVLTRSPRPHIMKGLFAGRMVRITYGFSYVFNEFVDHRPLVITIRLKAKPHSFLRFDRRLPFTRGPRSSGHREFDRWVAIRGSHALASSLLHDRLVRIAVKRLVSPTWSHTSQLSITNGGYLHLRRRSSHLSLRSIQETLGILSTIADRVEHYAQESPHAA